MARHYEGEEYVDITPRSKLVKGITAAVEALAVEADENAACIGDTTISLRAGLQMNLEYWLDGVEFERTGKSTKYGAVIKELAKKDDPDYQTYLELKARFEI